MTPSQFILRFFVLLGSGSETGQGGVAGAEKDGERQIQHKGSECR